MIRTVLVDDEILSRLGLRTFLTSQEDITVQEEFGNAADAIAYLRQSGGTDIVITDIEMSGMSGLEMIRTLMEENLAIGVVIVSCHADFHYAQDAIAAGAGAYLLKQDISEEKLVSAVREVYGKNKPNEVFSVKHAFDQHAVQLDQCRYAVGVLQFHPLGSEERDTAPVEEEMLAHLLDNVVRRHKIGTLFVPYKRDMFILFQFGLDAGENECRGAIMDFARDLSDNVRLYVNRDVVLGVSRFFRDTRSLRDEYDTALEAASLSFYKDAGLCRFYENVTQEKVPKICFTTDGFLEEDGCENFEEELCAFLDICHHEKQPVAEVKQVLTFQISQFVFRVTQEYQFSEGLASRWNGGSSFIKAIQDAEDAEELKDHLMELVGNFQVDLLTQLRDDSFQDVLQYIQEHSEKKLTLQEMANRSCMSISAFCRKFRQETGMTMIQYINTRKIEEVKNYLSGNYTLEEIADKTGFLNVNYMIRVFKRITGKTVTEYRRESHLRRDARIDSK